MPYVAKVASGELPYLNIFGDDYKTRDGTGERDYIHVMDLAEGHMTALSCLEKNTGFHVINLGTGKSVTVLDLISAFERISGRELKTVIVKRRDGDLPVYFANAERASILLNWRATRQLDKMCESAWHFYKNKTKSRE
jgi:UDP-glucose 4-epimerase